MCLLASPLSSTRHFISHMWHAQWAFASLLPKSPLVLKMSDSKLHLHLETLKLFDPPCPLGFCSGIGNSSDVHRLKPRQWLISLPTNIRCNYGCVDFQILALQNSVPIEERGVSIRPSENRRRAEPSSSDKIWSCQSAQATSAFVRKCPFFRFHLSSSI